MRTHNHLEVKEICRASIPRLMEHFKLGEIQTIKTDELGWVNPVFFVNDAFVFRFNSRDVNLPKIQREIFAYKLLKSKCFSVPDIIGFDDSKTLSSFDVMVARKIDGKNIEADWPSMTSEQRNLLSTQAGSILKEMHKIAFSQFGDLVSSSPIPPRNTWYEYLQSKLAFHIREAQDLNIFDSTSLETIWKNFNAMKYLMDSVTNASFVHVDFHFGNLLHKDFKIVGILDFEWSFWGDFLYDLTFVETMNETWPESNDGFLKGYGITSFTDEQNLKMKLYQMIRNIELCIVAKKHFSVKEADEYLQTTMKQIASLNRLMN